MKRIKTTALLVINSGDITLTGAQARTRMHCLTPVKVNKGTGDGVYTITAPIQFKAGEEFGYDGELNKAGVYFDPAVEAKEIEGEKAREREAARAQGRADAEKAFAAERAAMAAQIEKAFAEGRAAGLAEAAAAAPAGQGAKG